MGKLTISMAIFNSYVKLPEGTVTIIKHYHLFFPRAKDTKNWINGKITGAVYHGGQELEPQRVYPRR